MVDQEPKKKFSVEEQAQQILIERTPPTESVIFEPTIDFLDPEHNLTREEMGRVIAMGDRTAISYNNLSNRVIDGRGNPEATASFYLAYALSARSNKEVSHSSILEQINPGSDENGGDSPIVLEGISTLAALRDVCALRHVGLEALSSRGAVFPDGYWNVPEELVNAGVGKELEAINKDVYSIYLKLTEAGIKHSLKVLEKQDNEKGWQFNWRVLNSALDDSRQVLNQSFLSHLSMHPNSSLSLREAIVKLSSSDLPETKAISERLRELGSQGLPTLMKYTDPSSFDLGLSQKKNDLSQRLGLIEEQRPLEVGHSRFIGAEITPDAERIFLSAFLANGGRKSAGEIYETLCGLPNTEVDGLIAEVFEGIDLHDKPPSELELIQINAELMISVGAFYEAVRHRLATHISGSFISNMFTRPSIYDELGLAMEYNHAIDLNRRGRQIIAGLGTSYERVFAPYFASRADLVPVTMRISGMDVFHFLKLRASSSAHPDISQPSLQFKKFLEKSSAIFRHMPTK